MYALRECKGLTMVALLALAAGSLILSSGAEAGPSAKIVAVEVKSDPATLDAEQWSKAKPVKVVLDGAGQFENQKKEITVSTVYTDDSKISILLTWEDPARSMDGQAWQKDGDKWIQKAGYEDRVALNFEVRRIKNFATKGCTVLCHSDAKDSKEWKYHTDRAPQLGDLWVWESYRSDPLGHAGDNYVDDDSRKADKGTGKALKNINKYESGPAYMQDPAKTPPLADMLMDDQKVVIGDNPVNETAAWMLSKFSGDFADIASKSSYADGHWKVMLQRKLETDSESDVEFKTKKKYSFGIAVFDNSDRHHSYNSPPLKLEFD